jgi:hypothetical protein
VIASRVSATNSDSREVACPAPHDATVLAVIDLDADGAGWPEVRAVRADAATRCRDAVGPVLDGMDGFVGSWSAPGRLVWEQGRRQLVCVAAHEDGSALDPAAGGGVSGDQIAQNTALSRCHPSFDEYVGKVWADTRLGFTYVYPTAADWAAGSHTLVCYLWARETRPLNATMAGSGE